MTVTATRGDSIGRMRARDGFVVVTLVAAACGDSSSGTETSGSRLRARVLMAADSTADPLAAGVRVGWYDRDLELDCTFVADNDGLYRCLPERVAGLRLFSTSTCEPGTDVMAIIGTSTDGASDCSPALVRSLYEETRCDAEQPLHGRVLRVLGPADGSVSSYGHVQTYFGDCNPYTPPPDGPAARLCRVEEVDRSRFVAATAQLRVVGGVRQRWLLGRDGSAQVQAILHPDLDAPLYDGGGPDLIPDVPTTSEPWCGGGAVCFVDPPACANAVVIGDAQCGATAFSVGEPNGCGDECWTLGAALPSVSYEEVALGDERLRPLWFAQGGVPVAPTGAFHDQVLDTRCVPTETADGRVVCAPRDRDWGSWYEAFSDDACATPIGFVYGATCAAPRTRYRADGEALLRLDPTDTPSDPFLRIGPSDLPGTCVLASEAPVQLPSPLQLYAATLVDDVELVAMKEIVD